ncbi:hypothetical protein COT94_03830 [Candidatus Falkowbacteria bacterium CG10_big_fil_rev_8_21_14_0_10_37_14]|uniref:tRNA-dihydrouridine synthase n=1 Tax=Candidatus Falkowbacteria bacterium CG10_big_fil_rev_8_21_14_0_10_37_14 TaxID=1974561 RepID=A0A2M6WSE2_9BACT|nr:hypothetical protein [Candidatus Falkowbacteria bacterium]PIT95691.1 MAG: hypothetical protein COT94_03830 [Candidatus Falkowbacteria bacterium CG10_big_fil_rev_8_21_14_0_10_37_14]
MTENFWEKLKKPIIALAPMAGITDQSFRLICGDFGADVVYSEMANATALVYNPAKTLALLRSSIKEPPLVMQLFGANPEHFAVATKLLSNELGARKYYSEYRKPQGIDINFGCPVSKVIKTGSGAKLFQDIDRSRAVIKAVLNNTDLPVSIKIRSSSGNVTANDFLIAVADLPISAVMIHGRSLTGGFSGEIDYEVIRQARQHFSGIILANGGINTPKDAQKTLVNTGADGLGLARGILGAPWLISQIKQQTTVLEISERIEIIKKHADLVKVDNDNFLEFRKHLCWYLNGFPGAASKRQEAVKVENWHDVNRLLEKWLMSVHIT